MEREGKGYLERVTMLTALAGFGQFRGTVQWPGVAPLAL